MELAFLAPYYLWIKAFHIIMVICWMAGLFYVPRLFAYHTRCEKGSAQFELFKVMERRLMRIIINPAMIGSLFFGILLILTPGIIQATSGWFHLKMGLLFILLGFHGYLARCMRAFARGDNKRSEKFYRLINEIPPLLMIAIVILAIVKPF